MFCPHCGKRDLENGRFCVACGGPLEVAPDDSWTEAVPSEDWAETQPSEFY